MGQRAFTLVELLVTVALFSVISMAGFILFTTGQSLWSMVDGQIKLQENARQAMDRVTFELRESGRDRNDALQIWISDDSGPNNSDILRFAIPICPCGRSVMDENGEVRDWGAPLSWGKTGCGDNYSLETNGKVIICHVPPGNPNNPMTIEVAPAAVKAHLGHDDWIGECDQCDPASHADKYVEYRMNGNGQFLRRILDGNLNEVAQTFVGSQLSNFQAVMVGGQQAIDISANFTGQVIPNRTVTHFKSERVFLRNYE